MIPPLLKLAYLLGHPGETGVRIRNKFGAWSDRDSQAASLRAVGEVELDSALTLLFGSSIESFNATESLASLEAHLLRGADKLSAAPFKTCHNASTTLGRICYLTVRSIRPRLVMETG